MKIQELVGKWAVRIKPIQEKKVLSGTFGSDSVVTVPNEQWCTTPVFVKAVENEVVYVEWLMSYNKTKHPEILAPKFDDQNWAEVNHAHLLPSDSTNGAHMKPVSAATIRKLRKDLGALPIFEESSIEEITQGIRDASEGIRRLCVRALSMNARSLFLSRTQPLAAQVAPDIRSGRFKTSSREWKTWRRTLLRRRSCEVLYLSSPSGLWQRLRSEYFGDAWSALRCTRAWR